MELAVVTGAAVTRVAAGGAVTLGHSGPSDCHSGQVHQHSEDQGDGRQHRDARRPEQDEPTDVAQPHPGWRIVRFHQ